MSTSPLFDKLLILGVGLMGGSLGLAARQAGVAKEVCGWSRRQQTLDSALALGAIDVAEADLHIALQGADCVVIATPTQLAESLLVDVVQQVDSETLVTDVASVKGNLARALEKALGGVPDNVVLGHPVCGSEQSGVQAARADLYQQQKVILVDDCGGDSAREKVSRLWERVGAEVHTMGLQSHDQTLALTSHLPHMLSFALMNQLAADEKQGELFAYSGGGFRDFTRIAGSDPTMWSEIAMANSAELSAAIDGFCDMLRHVQQLANSGDDEQLQQFFADARAIRQARFADKP